MAEGFTPIPHNEVDRQLPKPEILTRRRTIAGAFEALGLRMAANKERKERLDDDDDEKLNPREGRIMRLLNRVFSRTVDREHIESAPQETEHNSLFFSIGESAEPSHVEAEVPEPSLFTEKPADVPEAPHVEAVPEVTVPAEVAEPIETDEVFAPVEAASEPVTDVEIAATTEAVPAEDRYNPEVVYVNRGITPETALVLGAYEHHRVTKLKRQNAELEGDVKQLDTRVEKTERANKDLKKEVAAERPKPVIQEQPKPAGPEQRPPETPPVRHTPEKSFEKQSVISSKEVKVPKVEQKQASRQESPESRAEVKAMARPSGELNEVRKQEIVEKILTAPERIHVAGAEEQKDIAYELSHEHKDMDKQAQANWAAIQVTADATAKANAEAFASASSQIPVAVAGTALKKAEEEKQREKKAAYQKAAIGGFISAIILIAIYIVILLLMKKN